MPRKRANPNPARYPQYPSDYSFLTQLQYAQPTSVQLRDGDLVVFRRPDSPLWQFRYRVKSVTQRY